MLSDWYSQLLVVKPDLISSFCGFNTYQSTSYGDSPSKHERCNPRWVVRKKNWLKRIVKSKVEPSVDEDANAAYDKAPVKSSDSVSLDSLHVAINDSVELSSTVNLKGNNLKIWRFLSDIQALKITQFCFWNLLRVWFWKATFYQSLKSNITIWKDLNTDRIIVYSFGEN